MIPCDLNTLALDLVNLSYLLMIVYLQLQLTYKIAVDIVLNFTIAN